MVANSITFLAGHYGGCVPGNSVGEVIRMHFARKVVIREGKKDCRRAAAHAVGSNNLMGVAF